MTAPYGWPQQPAALPFPPQQTQPVPPGPQWPQQYPPQPQYTQYQPQQFGAPPAPAQPLAQVGLDDFFSQPAVGSPSWSWKDKPVGTTYVGLVSRALSSADFSQNADMNGKPLVFRDGSPQVIMRVPMIVQPDASFPHGEATWIVNARHRDELVRAMKEAGTSDEIVRKGPEAGAVIYVKLTERRPNRSGNPSNIIQVMYRRPDGSAPVATAPAPVAPAPAAPAPVPAPAIPSQAPAPQFQQMPAMPVPVPAAPVAQAFAATAPPAPGAVAPQPPAGLDEAQQALLARLTGQAAS